MVRARLTPVEVERGVELGRLLRLARGSRTAVEVAAEAGVSVETLRKIERGLVPTPAFFTISALAGACDISLDDLASALCPMAQSPQPMAQSAQPMSQPTQPRRPMSPPTRRSA
jgi:transcriptional regulator with XRE-family HTH domain